MPNSGSVSVGTALLKAGDAAAADHAARLGVSPRTVERSLTRVRRLGRAKAQP
jgi:hypothetical protein